MASKRNKKVSTSDVTFSRSDVTPKKNNDKKTFFRFSDQIFKLALETLRREGSPSFRPTAPWAYQWQLKHSTAVQRFWSCIGTGNRSWVPKQTPKWTAGLAPPLEFSEMYCGQRECFFREVSAHLGPQKSVLTKRKHKKTSWWFSTTPCWKTKNVDQDWIIPEFSGSKKKLETCCETTR